MGEVRVGKRVIKTSSEDRIVFPRDGITKGEVIDYYRRIAPFMLPHRSQTPADDGALPT